MDERQKQENIRRQEQSRVSNTDKTVQMGSYEPKEANTQTKKKITDVPNGMSGSTWVHMANRTLQNSYQERSKFENRTNEKTNYVTRNVETNGQQMNTNEEVRKTHMAETYVRKEKDLNNDRDEGEENVQESRDRERRRRLYLAQKKKKKQQKKVLICASVILISIVVCGFAIYTVFSAAEEVKEKEQQDVALTSPSPIITSEITKEPEEAVVTPEPFEIVVQEALLTPNEYSRPGLAMEPITGVVIHYVGNPGTQGISNRNFFESLKDNHENSVSSHFIIGLQGEIIQCVPLDEVAYANRGRNFDTISIECCHPDEEGQFNEATYEALVQLAAYLLNTYGLGEEALLRHYEVTGKICPRYYVDHPEAWETLKDDIMKEVEEHPNSVLVME